MKRSYQQNCALANALDLVGERWTLLIVRELLVGPKRYKEFTENLPAMGTNLLAARLKHMTTQGLIDNTDTRYQLTKLGHQLEPVVYALIRFGLMMDVTAKKEYLHRTEWDSVALRALYQPDAALEGSYVLELEGCSFSIVGDGKQVSVNLGSCSNPVATVSLAKSTGRQLANGDISPTAAFAQGRVKTSGSRRQSAALLKAFGMG